MVFLLVRYDICPYSTGKQYLHVCLGVWGVKRCSIQKITRDVLSGVTRSGRGGRTLESLGEILEGRWKGGKEEEILEGREKGGKREGTEKEEEREKRQRKKKMEKSREIVKGEEEKWKGKGMEMSREPFVCLFVFCLA